MRQTKIIAYLLTVFVLLSCTPRTYNYLSYDTRLFSREDYVHEFLILDYNFSITIAVNAVNYSGQRRIGLTLTFSNGELDTARVDFRRIGVVVDGQVVSLDKPYLHGANRLIPDSVDYIFVVPKGSSKITVRADHRRENGVPHSIELQMGDVVSINDKAMEMIKQPIRFELIR